MEKVFVDLGDRIAIDDPDAHDHGDSGTVVFLDKDRDEFRVVWDSPEEGMPMTAIIANPLPSGIKLV